MSQLMMMHRPMNYSNNYQTVNQPNNQYVVQPPYLYNQPINPSMNQQMMIVPQYPNYQGNQSINQQPINQSSNQTMNYQSLGNQSITPSMNPSSNQSIPSSNEVRVSFSSMLVHPHLPTVIYYQLRADGHNQDLIIEHPTGWSIVKPEATFVEHLISQTNQARISREKWPIPQPMQLTFKSCDTSRLMPERTVTRYTLSRYSQMEWKEAMKAVKSLKDEEVVRAKMRVTFGLHRGSPQIGIAQAPVVLYESLILLGWRTTRSGVKRRSKPPTPVIKGESNQQSINQSNNQSNNQSINQSTSSIDHYVPELLLDPADSTVSTPSSQGSMNMYNQYIDRSSNERAREVHQSINDDRTINQSIDDLIGESRAAKRSKLFGEPIKQPIIDQLPFIKEQP